MSKTIEGTVSGKVQSVHFRADTCTQAAALHLTGWVKNLPNGQVAFAASGEEVALQQLIKWLWQGSSAAKVTDVSYQFVDYQEFQRFQRL